MIDAYTIGITLALNDGASAGIAAIGQDLAALDRTIAQTAANLVGLRRLGQQVSLPALPARPEPPENAGKPQSAGEPASAGDRSAFDQAAPSPGPAMALPSTPAVAPAQSEFHSDAPPRREESAERPLQTGSLARAQEPADRSPSPPVAPLPRPVQPVEPHGKQSDRTPDFARFAPPSIPEPPSIVPPAPQSARAEPDRVTFAAPALALTPGEERGWPMSFRSEAEDANREPLVRTLGGPPATDQEALVAHSDSDTPQKRLDLRFGPGAPSRTVRARPEHRDEAPAQARRPKAGIDWRTTPERASASDPSTAPTIRRTGDIYLDGARLGRWISEAFADLAARPASGFSGTDPRISPTFPGALSGN